MTTELVDYLQMIIDSFNVRYRKVQKLQLKDINEFFEQYRLLNKPIRVDHLF